MKLKNFLRLIGLIIAVLTALMVATTVLGQGEGPEQRGAPEPTEEPTHQLGVAEDLSAAAQPPYTVNYQGFLTDGTGNPLTGTHTLTFSLFISPTGGVPEWGPETHTIPIVDGFFSVVLGESITLFPSYFDQALFLEVGVDGTALSTRQPLRPVAYAYGLVAGAEINGDPLGANDYGLIVNNTSNFSGNRGLFVEGLQYAIYANERSALGDVAIFTPDFIEAQGYKSEFPSYLWVPGSSGVSGGTGANTVDITHVLTGTLLNSTAIGARSFYLPVTLPSELLGQEVSVNGLTLYYSTSNAATFIDSVRMDKLTGLGTSVTLVNSNTNLNSTIATSASFTSTATFTQTREPGSVNIQLNLNFANTAHTIYVGGARLELGHKD